MIDDEKTRYCAAVMAAARKLGIGIRKDGNGFQWADNVARKLVNGRTHDDPEMALFFACEDLTSHLYAGPQK